MKKEINVKFVNALNEEELSPKYDLKASVNLVQLLNRIQQITGTSLYFHTLIFFVY